jgi:hypothetical protein
MKIDYNDTRLLYMVMLREPSIIRYIDMYYDGKLEEDSLIWGFLRSSFSGNIYEAVTKSRVALRLLDKYYKKAVLNE